ncbi:MAG: hypothetical protein GX909_00360, partial [Clostridiaceae bacterium]|nr:hypothetical protein [Clostridiaceae bacterium]
VNIARLSNRHKEIWAYTVVDIDDDIDQETLNMLSAIEGVTRVRKLIGEGASENS